MIMYCIFGKIFEQLEVIFMFSMCCFSRTLVFWLEPGNISRGSMGRVPALKAESVFYFLRQEKRKRRDAIAKLEYKMMYFYNEATMSMKSVIVDDDVDLPPLAIHEIKNEKEYEKEDNDEHFIIDELMQWHNSAEGDHEDNFNSQVKSLDVTRVTEQQITDVKNEQVGNRAARHAPGIALVSLVQRAAEADGKKLADSIEQVGVHINEYTTLTKPANEYIEKFLAVLMPRIASVANKSRVSFSESFQLITEHASDFERHALHFCEERRDGLMFCPTTVALLAQGRAHNQIRCSETVRYAAMAEYMCREIFTRANSDSEKKHELKRADIKRVLRTIPFSSLCRKLGFGIEGE